MRRQLMWAGFASAFLIAISLGFSPGSIAQDQDCTNRLESRREADVGRPVLVFLESDPWLMVIGSDSPRFALYDDGLLIFRAGSGYKQTRLSASQAEAIRDSVRIGVLACHIGFYDGTNFSDQPTQNIFVGRGGGLSRISVYGNLKGPSVREKVPSPVVDAFDRLTAYSDPNAENWLPAKIEVMIWPYEYAPEQSIVWPSKWPGLQSAETVARGDSYSLFVPSIDYNELVAFLKTRSAKGAVEIGGKKWAVGLRFPFPQEDSWIR